MGLFTRKNADLNGDAQADLLACRDALGRCDAASPRAALLRQRVSIRERQLENLGRAKSAAKRTADVDGVMAGQAEAIERAVKAIRSALAALAVAEAKAARQVERLRVEGGELAAAHASAKAEISALREAGDAAVRDGNDAVGKDKLLQAAELEQSGSRAALRGQELVVKSLRSVVAEAQAAVLACRSDVEEARAAHAQGVFALRQLEFDVAMAAAVDSCCRLLGAAPPGSTWSLPHARSLGFVVGVTPAYRSIIGTAAPQELTTAHLQYRAVRETFVDENDAVLAIDFTTLPGEAVALSAPDRLEADPGDLAAQARRLESARQRAAAAEPADYESRIELHRKRAAAAQPE